MKPSAPVKRRATSSALDETQPDPDSSEVREEADARSKGESSESKNSPFFRFFCQDCGDTYTTQKRKGPNGPATLCNRCAPNSPCLEWGAYSLIGNTPTDALSHDAFLAFPFLICPTMNSTSRSIF